MAELIRESITLQQRLEETYDFTQICFTELEYCLAVPSLRNAKNSQGYYHQYWDAWKNFNLLFHLTYHERQVRERLGGDEGEEWIELNQFFKHCLKGTGVNLSVALQMISLWQKYDRVLRVLSIISLKS